MASNDNFYVQLRDFMAREHVEGFDLDIPRHSDDIRDPFADWDSGLVLDTNVISEILKGQRGNDRVVAWFTSLSTEYCYTTAINTAELLYGIALQPAGLKREQLSNSVNAFIRAYGARTLPFTITDSSHYAAIVATRRSLGRPIQSQDAMIAAIARSHGMAVATRNVRDFEDTGVTIINPWEE